MSEDLRVGSIQKMSEGRLETTDNGNLAKPGNRKVNYCEPCNSISLDNLPADVLLELLTYLDIKSLVSLARTCRLLRDLAYNSRFWKNEVINLSTEPLWIAEPSVCDSLVTRKLEILELTEAFSPSTKHVEMGVNHSGDKKRNQIIEQSVSDLSGQIGSRFRTFLSAIGPQSSFDIRLLSMFTNLHCLVLLYTIPHDLYKSLNDRLNASLTGLVNLKQLVLDIGIVGYQTVNYIRRPLKQATIVALHVPQIVDLTLGKTFWNGLYQQAMETTRDRYSDTLPHVKVVVTDNVKRLSLMGRRLGHAAVTYFSRMFPNVRHLCISHPKPFQYHIFPDDIMVFLEGFTYLESLQLGDIDEIQNYSVSLIPPTLKALRLCGYMNHFPSLTSKMSISSMLSRAASSLRVLVISVPYLLNPEYYLDKKADRSTIISNICQTLKMLEQLEVFVIEPTTANFAMQVRQKDKIHIMNDEFYTCVEDSISLVSVIGVEFPDRSVLPPNLRFITTLEGHDAETQQPVLLHRSHSDPECWNPVNEISPVWHRAHGNDYFYIGEEITPTDIIIQNFVRNETRHRNKHFITKHFELQGSEPTRLCNNEYYW